MSSCHAAALQAAAPLPGRYATGVLGSCSARPPCRWQPFTRVPPPRSLPASRLTSSSRRSPLLARRVAQLPEVDVSDEIARKAALVAQLESCAAEGRVLDLRQLEQLAAADQLAIRNAKQPLDLVQPELAQLSGPEASDGEDEEGEEESTSAAALSSFDVVDKLDEQAALGPASATPPTPTPAADPPIPSSIVTISLVSMCLTLASCIFNSLMPVYMVTELKMSMRSMGVFEGLLEAFSYFVRMVSGIVSDLLSDRKKAIIFGFGLSATAKFGMSLSGSVSQLFLGKAVDKLANGIQAAPRDALIGDLAPPTLRGACFGFAQSLRKWGSTLGAVLAFVLMKATGNNYKLIFTLASAISLASCIAFAVLVPAQQRRPVAEAEAAAPVAAAGAAPQQQATAAQLRTAGEASSSGSSNSSSSTAQAPRTLRQKAAAFVADLRSMGSGFYRMLSVVVLYGLGHINESLLEARAVEVGFGKAEATLVIALLSFVVFLSAYPMGKLDDKYGSRTTFTIGMSALIAGDLVLLFSSQWPMAVFAACLLWGVHWAVVQGPLLSMVVQLSPPNLRGTAFGIFYTVMALTAVAANTAFGHVWHQFGATSAFGLSAAIVTATLLLLPKLLPDGVGRPAAKPQAAFA